MAKKTLIDQNMLCIRHFFYNLIASGVSMALIMAVHYYTLESDEIKAPSRCIDICCKSVVTFCFCI